MTRTRPLHNRSMNRPSEELIREYAHFAGQYVKFRMRGIEQMPVTQALLKDIRTELKRRGLLKVPES